MLLSVLLLYHIFVAGRKPLSVQTVFDPSEPGVPNELEARDSKKSSAQHLVAFEHWRFTVSRTAVEKELLGTTDLSD